MDEKYSRDAFITLHVVVIVVVLFVIFLFALLLFPFHYFYWYYLKHFSTFFINIMQECEEGYLYEYESQSISAVKVLVLWPFYSSGL